LTLKTTGSRLNGISANDFKKNQFEGETVFAVCTAPSVQGTDWERVVDSGAYLWGCGLSYELPDVPYFDMYSVTEQMRLPIVEPAIRHLDIPKFYNHYKDSHELFVNHGFPDDDPPKHWRETRSIQAVDTMSPDLEWVSHVPEASVFSGVVQPALWLGFQNIYIVGCDFSHNYQNGTHRSAQGERFIVKAVNKVTDMANEMYPDRNIALVDCDKTARPVLFTRKVPIRLNYITMDEALPKPVVLESDDAVHTA
jgi:hypothetical protein